MKCPKCGTVISDKAATKAHNAAIAKKPRPGARGLVRNPAGRLSPQRRKELEEQLKALGSSGPSGLEGMDRILKFMRDNMADLQKDLSSFLVLVAEYP